MSSNKRGRTFELALLSAASSFVFLSCSSGLEGLDAGGTSGATQPPESTNLRFAFELGVPLTHPVSDVQVAGGVLPTAVGSRERPVAFFAFVTQAVLPDPDDLTADANGVEDVFLAAVDTDSIDPRAFSYAMAGTMRHPRPARSHGAWAL